MSMQGKVCLITGGARGMGFVTAKALAAKGAQKIILVDWEGEFGTRARDEINGMTGRDTVDFIYCDLSSRQQVRALAADINARYDSLHVLINNAGIVIDKALMMMAEEDWTQVIDTNLNGMFHAARACIVTFMKQKSGNIINISSVSGITGLPRQTNYSASKGGMNSFTKALAKEVAEYGVRVNAIAPGYIETEILSGLIGASGRQ